MESHRRPTLDGPLQLRIVAHVDRSEIGPCLGVLMGGCGRCRFIAATVALLRTYLPTFSNASQRAS
jgi:hypothetical protein